MSNETREECLQRIQLMADGDPTWDLSENDRYALLELLHALNDACNENENLSAQRVETINGVLPMGESKWIYFVERPPERLRKLSIWEVRAKDGEITLGWVRFVGRWRCFAFYPSTDTLYEKQCLRDIADFCDTQTKRWRETIK